MKALDAFNLASGAANLAAFIADKSLWWCLPIGGFCIFAGLLNRKRPA